MDCKFLPHYLKFRKAFQIRERGKMARPWRIALGSECSALGTMRRYDSS